MQSILDLFAPLGIQSWYVLAAFLLAVILQVAKKTPVAKTVWYWLPSQWRWVWGALAGFATGFISGYQLNLPPIGSILSGLGGAFGVGILAGGINDWLEKSILPWPGSPVPAPILNHLDKPAPRKEDEETPGVESPPKKG